MKHLSLILAFFLSLSLSAQEITITGTITNPNTSYFILRTPTNTVLDSALLIDGKVTLKASITEGAYELYDGVEYKDIYLKPNYNDLKFSLDAKLFDETFLFEGRGADVNNYMNQKSLLSEQLGKYDYYAYIYKLDEDRFLEITDSVYNLKLDILNKYHGMEPELFEQRRADLNYELWGKYGDYENSYRYFREDPDFEVSESFPNPYEHIELDRKDLIHLYSYTGLVGDYIFHLIRESGVLKDTMHSIYYHRLVFIDSLIKDGDIKQALLAPSAVYYLSNDRFKDAYLKKFMEVCDDEDTKLEVQKSYQALKLIEPGNVSPDFSFVDSSGRSFSLNDFKGKYVYIDIWATWCGPCLKEIPRFQSLVSTYENKNIVFVGICQNDSYDRWIAMLKNKNLQGYQLFASDNTVEFFTKYQVNAIPRYILLDPNGVIIDSDAKRPSDGGIYDEFDELLK